MERYTEPTQSLPVTLPQMLKPLLRANYILGTFPYTIAFENGRVTLSKKSIHYYRALVTLFLVVATVFAHLVRIFQVTFSPRALDSNGNPVPIMNRLIELICSVHANFITMIILLLLFLKRKIVRKYLTEMLAYSECLRGYMDNSALFSAVRKLYTLYTFLGTLAAITVAVRIYQNPVNGPISSWFEMTGLDVYVSPQVLAVISAAFVFYLTVAKFACLGNLEVVSCAQAICFSRTIENLIEYLEGQMEIWKREFKGLESQMIDKDDFLNLLSRTTPEPRNHSSKSSNKFKPQSDLDDYIDQIREFNPGLIGGVSTSSSPSLTTADLTSSSAKISSTAGISLSGFKTTPGRALGHAARKFLGIASLQNNANSVFGSTLAINVGCIVVMLVILKYLVITNFISHFREHHSTAPGTGPSFGAYDSGVDNWTSTQGFPTTTANPSPYNNTADIGPDLTSTSSLFQWDSYHLDTRGLEWITFLGLDASMFIRLGVTVICLGKVHKTSIQFNQVMGKAFLTANRIIDEIATTLSTNSVGINSGKDVEEVTRALMTPTQMSSIIAFMNLNNANPVAFTAAGLFVFSRGLLLMIVSIIVTYLVFLLQASSK